jgi:hypothetical protein
MKSIFCYVTLITIQTFLHPFVNTVLCLEQNYEGVAFTINGGKLYRNRYNVVS